MHICKFKRRNIIFKGNKIRTRACKSCHVLESDIVIKIKEYGEETTYVLPKGSLVNHIRERIQFERRLRSFMAGNRKHLVRWWQ